MKKIFLSLVLLFLLGSGLSAKEEITDFDVSMYLKNDGSAKVVEKISVISEGRTIHHGIYRDYITVYKDEKENKKSYSIKIFSVKRDGRKEPYHVVRNPYGLRLYIGSKNRIIPPGKYDYEIRVRFNNVINLFDDYDSLYYNVTGNRWHFDIKKAEFTLYSPENCQNNLLMGYEAFTGDYGQKGDAYSSDLLDKCIINFRTTRPLYMPGDGFTVLIKWHKGLFKKKSRFEYFYQSIADNFIPVGAMVIIFLYYFIAWMIVGKDPAKGIIIPEYESPDDLSPSAVRYIYRMGYDRKNLTVDIMGLASKGYLRIYEDNGEYTLEKITEKGKDKLPPEEKDIFDNIFKNGEILKIERKNSQVLLSSQIILNKILSKTFKGKYFFSNGWYFFAGLLLSVFLIYYVYKNMSLSPDSIFFSIWILFWTMGIVIMIAALLKAVKVKSGGAMRLFNLFVYSFMLLAFILAEIVVFIKFADLITVPLVIFVFYFVIINWVFYQLLKAPTVKGRKIMDRIEGLKLYLSVAEKERLEALTEKIPPQELYEKFLPYAAALDVENSWSENFDSILRSLSADNGYSPSWYSGTGTFDGSSFINGFSSSVTSAMSSSSSSSGGGFSGGGGGGGGGGGW